MSQVKHTWEGDVPDLGRVRVVASPDGPTRAYRMSDGNELHDSDTVRAESVALRSLLWAASPVAAHPVVLGTVWIDPPAPGDPDKRPSWFVPIRLVSSTVVRGLYWIDGEHLRLVELAGDLFASHAIQIDTSRPLEDPDPRLAPPDDLRAQLRRQAADIERDRALCAGAVPMPPELLSAARGKAPLGRAEEIALATMTRAEIIALSREEAIRLALLWCGWNETAQGYRLLAIWAKAYGRNPYYLASDLRPTHGGAASMLLRAHAMRRSPEILSVLGEDWVDDWGQP